MRYGTVAIGEICKYITSGGTPRSNIKEYYFPPEVPWLKTKEVNYFRIYETETYISKEGLQKSSAKLIPENSIIVAMYGQGDTAGRVAINKIPLTTNQACCNLIIDPQKADYEYVYYAMVTLYEKIVSLKNGGAQPNLNAKIIREIEIPFPDIETQHRIADILSAYDDLIENNKKQIKLLEEAAQRLYKEWFVDLHFPGYENTKIIDGVPEGWFYRRVGDFGEVVTGKTPSTSKSDHYGKDVPFVTIPDMQGNVFPLKTEKMLSQIGADSQQNKYLPTDSVLVSCIATVGLVSIVKEVSQTNQQINAVILEDKAELYFFYETMKRIKVLLEGVGSNGATMTNVNKNKFSNIEVLYPGIKLVLNFNSFCEPLFNQIYLLSKSNLKLQCMRDELLVKIMNRDIEV